MDSPQKEPTEEIEETSKNAMIPQAQILVSNPRNAPQDENSTHEEFNKEIVGGTNNQREHPLIFYQGKAETPSFLLSVRIFGKLLNNCLVDSGASGNVMHLTMCKRLGLIPTQTKKKVTQLDKREVHVIGELNNIHMQLAVHPRIQSCIDISIVDIPDGYGMLLSREWSRRPNGYISTDFSHMWLPWKGVPNQIKIDNTPRLRLMITEYGEDNEILFLETNLGSYRPKVEDILMIQGSN